jgi:hypothetical protein
MEELKSDKKYSVLLIAFFMTIALDTVMTFVMTSINTGWNAGIFQRWLQAWIIGFAVAFPTSIFALPLARKLTALLMSE